MVVHYELARTTLDPGLFSDNAAQMQPFYDAQVGLEFFERLDHSETYAELFFKAPGGKLKIQASTTPMEPAISGYQGLFIARDGIDQPRSMVDPDGLPVVVAPLGYRGVTQIGFTVKVPDAPRQQAFYREGMGATDTDDGLLVGATKLFVEEDASIGFATPPFRRGFTYITLIVHDCNTAHAALVAAGGQPSLHTLRLAERCNFAWVRDPHGNWIEIVQYADLSGPLPPADRLEDHWNEVTRWREEAIPF
jgi:predicted enzyme related to lactoylglutathione lyase